MVHPRFSGQEAEGNNVITSRQFYVHSPMALTKRKAKRAAKRYWPLAAALFGIIIVAVVWAVAPVSDWIEALGHFVQELGTAGPVLYVVLYVIGTVVLAPSPLISIAAGAAFGWWGLPLAVLGATLGACASFLLARYCFDDTLDDWLADRPTFKAAKRAVDEEGWRIQILLRVSPVVPFGALNYLLGLTRTDFTTYVACTALGIFPGSVVDIYIGVLGANANNNVQLAYSIVGLIVTGLIVVLITFKAKAYLREAGVKA
jgi:uncharacterized membrane protein YdjX (TVP38/TMEM64 family)